MSPADSVHVKVKARTDGIRLETLELGAPDVPEPGGLDPHNLRGVDLSTRTCKVGTARQALQNSNDASCSSSVDVYQHFFPSHAWFKATTNASSRQGLPPDAENNGSSTFPG